MVESASCDVIIPGIAWYYYMAALGMLSAAVAMVIELASLNGRKSSARVSEESIGKVTQQQRVGTVIVL